MQKLSIKLNKDLLDGYKFNSRKYKNKDGQQVEVKEYELEVILNKEEVLKSGDTWELVNKGFVTGKGVKQADGKYSKEPIFGNVTEIRDKSEIQVVGADDITTEFNLPEVNVDLGEVEDYSQIPF